MSSLEELRQERLEKLQKLKSAGLDPYPSSTDRTHTISEARSNFESLAEKKDDIRLAGRITALREHGGSVFVDIDDGTGEIQAYLKEDVVGESFELFVEAIDRGDFIEFDGHLFTTNRGEESIKVDEWDILTKSIRPLPEKWHGLQDTEKRLRRRYLDMLFNDEVRDMIEKRARFWQSMREFLKNRGFLEVETPVLETTTGGADARPFETHHNALDMDVYLRISAGELWQKQLMVGGFDKVFEIGRIFRNEGISPEHLQDYTQMEFYWAYADYEDGMEVVKELFRYIAEETFGTLEFSINGFDVDFADEWKRYDYVETIEKETGINVIDATLDDVTAKLDELGVGYEADGLNRARAIDALWKHCRKKIAGPGFLVGVPTELSPLAKERTDQPGITERFQPIIAGSELGNGYSELNDPIDQKERFEKQQQMRDAGDAEAQMYNKEFIEALEYGMPPTCGFGMSERVFAFLMDMSVRQAQIFPLMKPRQ